ncbi:ABC transporter ATP-binding protein [Paenibacillus rigui]|uniref:Aliphatic sulfonate ABC transporter ATP-binding protein n=1 Tax=Paenibacillus rigui TaxID=554312 RepID=A0A229UV68_9BACL|nr:ATP-binding cassette domain-containing protein [Paenibacillus rigui]OXM87497.1 aliphatic sulfonate ABC transporter ATP-binding protein [Paenibacillus rigui]
MTMKEDGVRLHTRNLGISFGGSDVLKDIHFQAEPGEFVAIVGRSGCGKSTLLRLVAGLEKPSDGLIMIDGHATKGIHPDTRVLFQDSRLLPWRKAVDNVRIGVKSRDKQLAFDALKQVGLEEKANAWPAVLSGGQRQRVALARALAGSPRLLLLDEPLGALDALTRIEMQQLIERLWSEQRFTVLLVTHDVSEAVALADRVVLIEGGNIAMDVKITLPRPRERDSGFAYFEKIILDRLLLKEPGALQDQRELSYSI